AHEFHHAKLLLNKIYKNYAYNVTRGYGINGVSDGFQHKNLLANFSHLRHTKKYPWIKYFLNFIEESKND
ncbi:cobyrinic acid a,c-diamide synthase, partial [Gammaproteobacteria bacterium]|nr:cobyrinic acid a,c-diamide synthase [Gammaproteobacteria bacterium]